MLQGPVTDGVTFPKDPMSMLREGLVNPAHVILGAQTNDSFLFLSRDYTRGDCGCGDCGCAIVAVSGCG